MFKRIVSLLVISMLTIGLAVGCDSENKTEDTLNTIRIGYFKGSPQIQIAKEDNLFEKYFGKDVEIQYNEFQVGTVMIEALVSGKIDFAITADQPPVTAIANNQPIEIVGVAGRFDKAMAIISNKESGVKVAEDLKGKKIGVALGTSLEYFVDKYLEKYGLGKDDVTFVNLATPEDIGSALASKSIDVAVTNYTIALLLESQKVGDILAVNGEVVTTISPILTTKSFREKHPEAVKNYIKVINDELKISSEQKDRVISISEKNYGLSKDIAEKLYQSSGTVFMTDEDKEILYKLYEFLKKNNIVSSNLKKDDLYTEVLKPSDLNK